MRQLELTIAVQKVVGQHLQGHLTQLEVFKITKLGEYDPHISKIMPTKFQVNQSSDEEDMG